MDSRTNILPNFIIVGAMKAGTTSLLRYLPQHPQIFMAPKECHFFSDDANYARGLQWYSAQFESACAEAIAIGEKTPTYSFAPEVAGRIHKHLPEVKLIWIFRDPVARAYSNYWHVVRNGAEALSFDRAIVEEEERTAKNIFNGYARRSLYADQVERFLGHFGKDQMLFLVLEDFLKDPPGSIKRVFQFLGVDAEIEVEPAPNIANQTYLPRSIGLQRVSRKIFGKGSVHRIVTNINRRSSPGYPPMNPETAARLRETFREPNRRLAELIGADLSSWEPRDA